MHASQIFCMFNFKKINMWNFNFGQSIWDKSVVLLGTWGEPLGTWWEHIRQIYFENKKTHTPPNPKEKNCPLLFVKPSPRQHENCDFNLGQYLSLTLWVCIEDITSFIMILIFPKFVFDHGSMKLFAFD
jgi:hypothetical protein